MSDIAAELRAVIQRRLLDPDAEGWSLAQFVISMGLERVRTDGTLETTSWYWAPSGQADWMTTGLLEAAVEMHAAAEEDD